MERVPQNHHTSFFAKRLRKYLWLVICFLHQID